ncbi:MAG TPA: PA2169 family four-helix-bundle protein [Planctomycetota bacterium]|nr:PA2169 family four-helix-bundle protein [Planctomycetota bacterium]
MTETTLTDRVYSDTATQNSVLGNEVDRERALQVLDELIRTCKNEERGLRLAAEGLTDGDLRVLFKHYAWQTARFVEELREEAAHLMRSGKEREAPSSNRFLPCGWIGVRSALNVRDEAGIISECGQGVHAALKVYEDALGVPLPGRVNNLLREQFLGVKKTHDCLLALSRLD